MFQTIDDSYQMPFLTVSNTLQPNRDKSRLNQIQTSFDVPTPEPTKANVSQHWKPFNKVDGLRIPQANR